MARLTLDAINPVPVERWSRPLAAVRLSRWDVTCGFCRTRFRNVGYDLRTAATCPACGTRNLLSLRRGPAEPLA